MVEILFWAIPKWCFRPTWKSILFPRIGLDILRKHHKTRVRMWLFCKQSHTGPQTRKSRENSNEICKFLCMMVLEWRDSEHGYVEEVVKADLMAQQTLRACGIYQFWFVGSLSKKWRLLQLLVDDWDPDSETFQLDRMSLSIEAKDI